MLSASKLSYCDDCMDKLQLFGGIAYEVFENICHNYAFRVPFILSTDIHDTDHGYLSIITFLESKGYVLTTESSENSVAIIPKGFRIETLWEKKVCEFCK